MTDNLFATSCRTRDELIERLLEMRQAGLRQVAILPNFDTRHDVLESVAANLIEQVGR